ncbi:Crp/Fnr family transcriptional regulator [Burkholderiaceae bacterium DAT-1]|nr:Crp/Fnr family transcriptional regulator [Burkholderiaceae bacterium DAT-1]
MTQSHSAQTFAPLLRTGSWFASLPDTLQSALLALAQVRQLAAGETLFVRGDAPDGLYCVVDGCIRVSGLTESGNEALLAMLDAPQWFGEIALFDRNVRTHDARAEVASVLLHVPQNQLEALLDAHPHFWRHMGRLLTQRLRILFGAVEDLLLLEPTERVARRLASMATGYGALDGASKRMVRVSQEQLGTMLALSRQTVNQALKTLESTGAIRRSRGEIEIVDMYALQSQSR